MISLMFQRVTLTAGWHAACKTIKNGCKDQAVAFSRVEIMMILTKKSIKADAKNGQIKENSPDKANRICS